MNVHITNVFATNAADRLAHCGNTAVSSINARDVVNADLLNIFKSFNSKFSLNDCSNTIRK